MPTNPFLPPGDPSLLPEGAENDDLRRRREMLAAEQVLRVTGVLWQFMAAFGIGFVVLEAAAMVTGLVPQVDAGLALLSLPVSAGALWMGGRLRALDPSVAPLLLPVLLLGICLTPCSLLHLIPLAILLTRAGRQVLTAEGLRIREATPQLGGEGSVRPTTVVMVGCGLSFMLLVFVVFLLTLLGRSLESEFSEVGREVGGGPL